MKIAEPVEMLAEGTDIDRCNYDWGSYISHTLSIFP